MAEEDAGVVQGEVDSRVENVDTVCITIAKAASGTARSRAHMQRACGLASTEEKEVRARMWNDSICFSAERGNIEEAEAVRRKLDSRRGYHIAIRSLTALIRAYLKVQNFHKADELFKQVVEPAMHPELGNVKPDWEFFHYMVSLHAEAGKLALAERYFAEMRRFKVIPSMRTFRSLMQSCIVSGQARRAHPWVEQLVKEGCVEVPSGFPPAAVLEEREYQRSSIRTHWQLNLFDAIVAELVEALAEAGHTQTANSWLGYLVECGLGPRNAPDLWEHVRGKHPVDIIPTLISGEATQVPLNRAHIALAPSVTLPARLRGEAPHARGWEPFDGVDRLRPWTATTPRPVPNFVCKDPNALGETLRKGTAFGLREGELRPVRAILAIEERKARVRAKLEPLTPH